MLFKFITIICLFFYNFTQNAIAYPIFAKQYFATPREARGRIVCSNCHLAAKPVEIKIPQTVLPSQIFDVQLKIPVSDDTKQILENGSTGDLNSGGIVILPENFKFISSRTRKFIQKYSDSLENILIFGPIPSKKAKDIHFQVQAPEKTFGSFQIYFGGNRGRGQIYPNGQMTKNNPVLRPVKGIVQNIDKDKIQIDDKFLQIYPGFNYIVEKGQFINENEAITNNPNVGGFGQTETVIVVRPSTRLITLQFFLASIFFAQTFLILKKKQIEIYE